jgi:hypothetical protein
MLNLGSHCQRQAPGADSPMTPGARACALDWKRSLTMETPKGASTLDRRSVLNSSPQSRRLARCTATVPATGVRNVNRRSPVLYVCSFGRAARQLP